MNRAVALTTLTTLLVACGGSELRSSGQPTSPAYPADTREPTALTTESASQGASTFPAAPAAAAAPEAPRSSGYAEREAAARPGLGTSWGETRSSHVTTAPFERDDSDSPFVTVSIFYNDAEGIHAMSRGGSLGARERGGVEVAGGALTVRLLDEQGRPLPTYDVGARRYVIGSDGERYVMQLRNNTGHRIEAVATVDGLDVIDGRPGSFEKRGYLLRPWATVEIDGFRQSLDEVAAFRFGAVRDAYAAKKGDSRNVGVIGVAFFNERYDSVPFLDREVERRNAADPFPGRFAAPPSE